MSDTYLLRPEAAEFLTERGFPVSKLTLQKWATTGGGLFASSSSIEHLYNTVIANSPGGGDCYGTIETNTYNWFEATNSTESESPRVM